MLECWVCLLHDSIYSNTPLLHTALKTMVKQKTRNRQPSREFCARQNGEEAKTPSLSTNTTILHRGNARPDAFEAPMAATEASEHLFAPRMHSKTPRRRSLATIGSSFELRRRVKPWVVYRGATCPDAFQSRGSAPKTRRRAVARRKNVAELPARVATTPERSAACAGGVAATAERSGTLASGVFFRPLG